MSILCRRSKAAGFGVAALGLLMAMPAEPAHAQVGEFFESLFGGLRRASQQLHGPREVPPEPTQQFAREGGGQAYCVRTCDGRFFPLQRHGSMSPTELCNAFCPASSTRVFHGGGIERAVSGNIRYSELPNAFLYRQRVVDDCTCNGRDAFGLARVDIANDDTLRPGDIVATEAGLATYRGRDRDRNAQFTPINPSAGDWARRLVETEVVPQRPVTAAQPVAYTPIPDGGAQRTASRNVSPAP